jgi:tape measure domain-containing protein
MNALPDLKANLVLDDTGFKVTASRAGVVLGTLSQRFDDVSRAAARTDNAIHNFGSGFRNTIVTLGALKFLLMDIDGFFLSLPKSIAKTAGEFQRLQIQMEGLSKAATLTKQRLDSIADMTFVVSLSSNAPFEVGALADSFVKLKTAGIDPTNGSMQALVDSVAKFGGSNETLKRASVAIQQMAGKGVISMEELRQQLGEAIPNAMALMARGMGLSIAELTAKVSKGVVTSRTALARMFIQMQMDAAGTAEKMMNTLPGALSQLTTEWHLFQKTIADQGFIGTVVSGMKELTAAFKSPEGQKFAREVGDALRNISEFLINTARWFITNIDLVKQFSTALLALWGGSKLANVFKRLSERTRQMAEERERVAARAVAANERERASLARLQASQEQALQKIEQRRDQALARAEERLRRQRAAVESSIASEQAGLVKLEQRKAEIQADADKRADARRDARVNAELRKAEEGRKRLEGLTGRVAQLKDGASTADQAKQEQFERKRAASLERLNQRTIANVDQLQALQLRREDLVAQKRQENEERLNQLTERRAGREADLDARRQAAQEKLTRLETQRQALMNRAKNEAVRSIESNTIAQTKKLAEMQGQILAAESSNLTDTQRNERVNALRMEETVKRAAYDREITHLNEVRARRLELEEIHKRELAAPTTPVKGDSGRFVSPTSAEGIAAIEKRNALRAKEIADLRAEETARSASARAMQTEERAAQGAADALAKHKNVSAEDLDTMRKRAAALESEITQQKTLAAQIKQSGLSVEQYSAKVQAQLTAVDAQIVAQKRVVDGHTAARAALQAEFEEKSRVIQQAGASTRAIDTEIARKTKLIESNLAEIESLKKATFEKGQTSARTAAAIADLERQIVAQQGAIAAHVNEADALRRSTAEHDAARGTIARKIAKIDEDADATRKSMAANQQHLQTLRAQVPATNAHIDALNRQAEGLRRNIENTGRLAAAKTSLASAVGTAGSAIAGFGRTLIGSIGFAVAFAAVIEGGIALFQKLTEKTRNAEAAQQALNRARLGMPAEGDVAAIDQGIADKKGNIDQRLQGIKNLQTLTEKAEGDLKRLNERLAGQLTDSQRADVRAQIEGKSREIATYAQGIRNATEEVKKLQEGIDSAEAGKRAAAEKLKEQDDAAAVAASLARITANFESRKKELDALRKLKALEDQLRTLRKEGKTEEAEKLESTQKKKLGEEFAEAQLATFNRAASMEMTRLQQMKGTTADQMKLLTEKIGEQRDSLRGSIVDATNPQMLGGATKPPKDSWLDNFIEAQRVKAVEVVDSSREIAERVVTAATLRQQAIDKVNALLDRNDGGINRKTADPKKVDEAVMALYGNLLGEETNAAQKKFDALVQRVLADRERLNKALEGEGQVLQAKNPALLAVDKMIAELEPKKDLLKVSLDGVKLSWEDFVKAMRGAAMDANLADTVSDLIKETEKLSEETETDERARQRRITADRIENVRKRVEAEVQGYLVMENLSAAQIERIRTLYKNFEKFIDASNENLAKKTRTPIQIMADQWAKGMDAMREASVNWANDFVDRLVEGNLKFGEFVEGILKDIAKIKLKEVLSDSIGGFLESGVQAIGEMIGLKGMGGKSGGTATVTGGAMHVLVTNPDVMGVLNPPAGATPPLVQTEATIWQKMQAGLQGMWDKMKTVFTDIGAWTQELIGQIPSMLSNLFGGTGGMGGSMDWLAEIGTMIMSFFGFAKGGIMTSAGPAPLRKYANGGIARSPQLAMFGEGSKPEAFVPLPDGRTIPVTMAGKDAASAAPPAVTVNVINQSGTQVQAQQKGQRFDGKQMILDVVLSGMAQPGTFRDNMRNLAQQNQAGN